MARLARVAVDEADVPALRKDLAAVLAHADALRKLDLSGVEPMSSPVDAVSAMREDTAGPSVAREEFLSMAPAVTGEFLKVPKVLGDGSSA